MNQNLDKIFSLLLTLYYLYFSKKSFDVFVIFLNDLCYDKYNSLLNMKTVLICKLYLSSTG